MESDEIPDSVEDAVLSQADRLTPDARVVIEIVSIFPRRAALNWVMGLFGTDCQSAWKRAPYRRPKGTPL